MKKIGYIAMIVVSLLLFFSMYVIVCLVTEEEFPGLKYLIMVIGYVSIALFGYGFLLFISNKNYYLSNEKNKETNEMSSYDQEGLNKNN